ncbi:unnamed protein product [Ilex paraguariensis]|uniref:Uncharacterized protein n=1 Tax=Ilex paraguariensis TaxID=185542 RepID=A0ABC8UD33_9AQUA
MYKKAANKANGEQQHEDNGGIIIDNEGVVLLPNTNAQPVLFQDPQLPPLPPTTFNTMSSAMLTYPRYGYGYGVPTNGVALPNRLNVDSPSWLDISDYLVSFDSLVGNDDDMMPALPSDTTHSELSYDDNKSGPS